MLWTLALSFHLRGLLGLTTKLLSQIFLIAQTT